MMGLNSASETKEDLTLCCLKIARKTVFLEMDLEGLIPLFVYHGNCIDLTGPMAILL